jgi:hypothetical protein
MPPKHPAAIAAAVFAISLGSAASAQHAVVRQPEAPRASASMQPASYHALLPRDRVVAVVRARHIRFLGTPYLYNGRYLMRCYDSAGRLGYCQVDPYSGAFIGVDLRLDS